MNNKILKIITDEYDAAVAKHPCFAGSRMHAVSLITEELGELAQAINDNDIYNAITEAAHVAVTAIRMMTALREGEL